ncbi:MAG: short-chain dehydrogenase/reductase [Nitrososphaeraceae archaeon]|nr:short-chain dehydrogenase/reductase [Nitrososphaeraceae archaeon]
MENQHQIAVVTGSSTGIGFETSLLLARNGFYTYATMRDTTKSKNFEKIVVNENLPLEVLYLDVDKSDSVKKAINKILEKNGKIDVLINNAGYGLFGALEDMSIEGIKEQFETNLFGTIRTIKEVLPIMRNQKKGIIVNISSMSGIVGIPATSIYVSTKYALEGLSESMSYELEQYGIKVILIEPGVIKTNFVSNIKFPDIMDSISSQALLANNDSLDARSGTDSGRKKNLSSYSVTVDKFLSHYYPAINKGPLPKEVSNVILEAIKNVSISSESFFRYLVGEDAKSLAEAKKSMSDSELHKFISQNLL